MVALINELPPAPSRSTSSNAEFVLATDQFIGALSPFVFQANALALEVNDKALLVQASVALAAAHADRAEAAAGFRVSIAFRSWVELSALAGTYHGQTAAVPASDNGVHEDPVLGEIQNGGLYSWSTTEEFWLWYDDGETSSISWANITEKPASFLPAPHSHGLGDIVGLSAALGGKAANGAIGTSGLTMATAKLLGRSDAGSGPVQEIVLGSGLSFDGVTLNVSAGGGMVYPASGIAVSSGGGWGTALAIPSGALVGTTANQTLTNKTLGSGTVISGGTIQNGAMTGGEIRASVSITDTGTIAANSPGMRGLPLQSAANRTLQASDMGKLVRFTGDITIPTGLPVGFVCRCYNHTPSNRTIYAASGVSVRLTGTASVVSGAVFRTVPQRGAFTVTVVDSNEVTIEGTLI